MEPAPLDAILNAAVKTFHWEDAVRLRYLKARWAEAVGPALARQAHPVGYREGVLTVIVPSSVWAQEMTYLLPTILQKLGRTGDGLSPVVDVRIRVRPGVGGQVTDTLEAPAKSSSSMAATARIDVWEAFRECRLGYERQIAGDSTRPRCERCGAPTDPGYIRCIACSLG